MKVSRLAAAGALAGSAVLALSGPAFAHVTVQPEGTAAKGGYAVIDFKVPNERENASTTRLEVTFPTDHPLASALPEPVPGWKTEVTKSKPAQPVEMHGEKINEVVSKITWTADGKGVEPGYFEKFPVSVGALPEDADHLVFKALQTYSDNKVVRWIEVRQDGGQEPANPAPVLTLSAATADGHGAATAEDAAQKTTCSAADSSGPSGDGTDTTARVLGVVGIVVGALGVAYGVLAGRRRTEA